MTESLGNASGAFTFLDVQPVSNTGHFKKNTGYLKKLELLMTLLLTPADWANLY